MQPMLRQVPPRSLSFSIMAAFKPNCPARMAAMYPPGPEPMITTSNFSIGYFCHSDRSGGISYCYLSCSTSTPKSSQLGLTRPIRATFSARDHLLIGSPAQLHHEYPDNARNKL